MGHQERGWTRSAASAGQETDCPGSAEVGSKTKEQGSGRLANEERQCRRAGNRVEIPHRHHEPAPSSRPGFGRGGEERDSLLR
mmetsp:Transcript_28481/g.67842  ORF Transcript_28481/g.67842 Transcript_28481/m.67842 type:complete len:83 (-) Transcript_28481:799-1047(-)